MKKVVQDVDDKRKAVFYINEEQRIVTCVLKGCKMDAFSIVDRYCGAAAISDAGYLTNFRKYPDEFQGFALCREDDEFDEEHGMRLALSRAMRARLDYRNNELRKLIGHLQHLADILSEHAVKDLPPVYKKN